MQQTKINTYKRVKQNQRRNFEPFYSHGNSQRPVWWQDAGLNKAVSLYRTKYLYSKN